MTIEITTKQVINTIANSFLKVKLEATGGSAPYVWSARTTLPNGVTLNSKGVLSILIKKVGIFKKINIKVVDKKNIKSKKSFTINVNPKELVESGLYAWGNNWQGGFGNNSTVNSETPILVNSSVKDYSVSFKHGSFIKKDGTLWCWGKNYIGQLGDNTTTDRSSPVQTIAGGNNWKYVSCGSMTTAAIKTDGTLWSWGVNTNGGPPDNEFFNITSSPVQIVAGTNNWKQVSCGENYRAAIKSDGTLWLWGRNDNGQLGVYFDPIKNTLDRKLPVETVAGGNNWVQVSSGYSHTAAIKSDGTLWLWGYNYNGQLGINSRKNKSSPVQTIAGGNNWKYVSCGSMTTAAIKTDGTLWMWGYGRRGELGNNAWSDRYSPVQVSGFGSWKDVVCGQYFTLGIKNNGSLWAWGDPTAYGLFGNATLLEHSNVPLQTGFLQKIWKKIKTYHADISEAFTFVIGETK
jgi:alpha-tubulin suppressor-like RCC1 family protein